MAQVVAYLLLALVVAFWTYREICVLRYERRRWQVRRQFRGVRIVLKCRVQIPPAPLRSTSDHRPRLVLLHKPNSHERVH